MSDTKVKEFAPEKFELEVAGNVYVLELSNEAIKKGDEMGIQNNLASKGISETLRDLIYIFGMKNCNISVSLARKIAESIINDQEYNPVDVVTELIEEFVTRYQQVFIVEGAKKTLKKV